MDTTSQRTATVQRPPRIRSSITNKPRRMCISGRTRLGRRILDLVEAYVARMGGWAGLSDSQIANAKAAAELSALCEQARSCALKTGNIDPIALVRLEGAALRAERKLNLPKEVRASERLQFGERLARELAGEVVT